jgi:hypothetical protein
MMNPNPSLLINNYFDDESQPFPIKVVIYQEGRVGIHHQSSYLSRGKGWDSSSK